MAHKESIVRKGYYEIAEEYSADRNRFDHSKDLKEFTELLPKKRQGSGCRRRRRCSCCPIPNRLRFKFARTRALITLNEPKKGSDPRIFNKSDLSPKLMNMLSSLPRINEMIFGGKTRNSSRNTFSRVRARLATKLQNPRLLEVHCHTLRHWALTMYQHKAHDIVLTARFAGHRNINNTMKYLHLEQMLFNDAQDDFIVKTAKTSEEAARLIEIGFQLQDVIDDGHIYRKRK